VADDLPRFQVSGRDFTPWVEKLDPREVSPGFNLFLFERRVPVIVDLSGRTVHHWPDVRAIGRARLGEDGNLLIIGEDDSVSEYSWDGERIFDFRLPTVGDLPHHDVRYLENGNILVLAQTAETQIDYLLEVNRDGEAVWDWFADEGLQSWIGEEARSRRDATHINSIQEIPPNRWFDKGDTRFRPGNILVSARNLNQVFIIERPSGRVVWDYRGSLDYQHEAIMVPKGQVGQGLITIFNNRTHRPSFARMSQILALDPESKRVVWAYENRGFFSSLGGSQQPLPNGNVMVTSTEGGRSFEVTVGGEIVWQWIPNVLPMRLVRYPIDHCPQLATAGSGALPVVERQNWRSFHDLELHAFGLRKETRRTTVQGAKTEVLREKNACRVLWLPPNPELHLSYGLDSARIDRRKFETRFISTVRPLPVGMSETLVDDSIGPGSNAHWRRKRILLDVPPSSMVELCIRTASSGDSNEEWAVKMGLWQNPQVFTDVFRVRQNQPPQSPAESEV
jgi:hypothetical protein